MKNYEKIEGSNKELKIEVYYNKGGMNYFSGKVEARGYYLSVSPVERQQQNNSIVIESWAAFSGTKVLIKEVTRKSEKAFQEAILLAEARIDELRKYVLDKNNLVTN
jgi:hypothetical protein